MIIKHGKKSNKSVMPRQQNQAMMDLMTISKAKKIEKDGVRYGKVRALAKEKLMKRKGNAMPMDQDKNIPHENID